MSERLRVASWNILNDDYVPYHENQASRLDTIAKAIRSSHEGRGPDIAFICEGISAQLLQELAAKTNMHLTGAPHMYTDNEWMTLMTRDPLIEEHKPEKIEGRFDHYAYLSLRIGNLMITGAHMLPLPIKDKRSRLKTTRHILDKNTHDKSLVMGDFNAFYWQRERRLLNRAGYTEVHATRRPSFPHPMYKGANLPRIMPRYNLDAMYSRGMKVKQASYIHSSASDHPLIAAELEL